MRVLATDTTGKSMSVALVQDGLLIGEMRLNSGYNHAVTHVPQIEYLLKSCSTSYAEIDLFACTRGPGSYTGTRIGLSTLKAMAYAAQKPAIGVSTLEVLAWPWRQVQDILICPLLDARNGRVFAAAYQTQAAAVNGSNLVPLIAPANCLATDFWELLQDKISELNLFNRPVWLTGDGVNAFLSRNETTLNQSLVRLDAIYDAPSAAVIANIAQYKWNAGETGDPFQLSAEYLSPSAAERLRDKQPE